MIQKKNKKNRKSICLGAQGRKKKRYDTIWSIYLNFFRMCREWIRSTKNKGEVFGNKARVLKNNAEILSNMPCLSLVALELIASAP